MMRAWVSGRGLVLSLSGVLACGNGDGGDGSGSGSTGTADTGDTSGTGGTGGTGTGSGTGGGEGECQTADDCQLLDDCCSCAALPKTESPDFCDAECDQTQCQSWGLGQIECRAGTCQVLKLDCDSGHATCNGDPPQCDGGLVPSVENNCWGPCVPERFCGPVDDCTRCRPEQICVELGGIDYGTICETVPAPCRDEVDPYACACQWLCPNDDFQMCIPGEDGIECVKMGG
jgi:hypothetical protein